MTRRYDHLWHDIVSFENLLLAYRRAARGKRSKGSVGAFEYRLEESLLQE